jgi:NodT family efflux transporter outer membrane factor (OMF) lipoprotein
MRKRIAVACVSVWLAGCSVGPKYKRPSAPVPPAYSEKPPANSQWKTAHPNDGELRANWWEEFGDPRLDALERKVPLANQNVKQAQAAFLQARALVAFNRAQYYPVIGTSPSVDVSSGSANLGGGAISRSTSTSGSSGGSTGPITVYSLPFSISWQPNFWGSISLAVQNAVALAQASAAQVENIKLSMQADLAIDYFSMEAADMQERLYEDTIRAYEKDLDLTQLRFRFGVASKGDVAAAQAQLEAARAALSDLVISRNQFEHAIAVLAGAPPAELTLGPGTIQGSPPAIPAGMPSQLLERRPDIATSERQVAAANAEVGLARVAYYPSVLLSAAGGFESTSITNWLSWPSHFWSAGVAVSETLLDFGRRHAQNQEARYAYDQTVATYRQTVLTAFQEVEDALASLRQLEIEEAQQAAAVKAAKESLDVALLQYKSGTASYLDVITFQAIALADERTLVQISGRRFTSTVQLILALGGGWNAAQLPTPSSLKKSH